MIARDDGTITAMRARAAPDIFADHVRRRAPKSFLEISRDMKEKSAEQQLAGFIVKFSPEIGVQVRLALAKMRKRLPGAIELVYDNYNALAIGFGPSERASEAIFSIAVFPRWVSLFFLQGARRPDPAKRLRGKGTKARHIVLDGPGTLDEPAVLALMGLALKRAKKPLDSRGMRRIIVKSVSEKQRPRRPA